MADKTWTKIGEIGVDAGICWIGDPCYILHRDTPADIASSKKEIGADWGEFCDKLRLYNDDKYTQFNFALGHPGLGVCVSTGYGDGIYDVLARFEGNRIAEVRVVFIDDTIGGN